MASYGAPGAITQIPRYQFRDQRSATQSAAPPMSYWMLLVFLLLLYANTPIVMPALEVIHPAKVVGGLAVLALSFELLSGSNKFAFAWPEGGLLLAFVAAAALSCVTALWPGYAVTAVLDLAKMILVYFFVVNCAATVGAIQGVMWTMIFGALFPTLGTLKNYLQGNLEEGRTAWVGIFANPNEVAYSLVILLPIAAYLASERGWLSRFVLLCISVLYVGAIFVTFSRGGVIGLVAVVAVYAWRKRNLWLQGALAVMVVVGLMFAGRFWSRGEDFSQLNDDISVQQRFATYEAGLNMFYDHPLLGVGFGCSVVGWPLYAPKGLYTRGSLVTHNTLIQVLSETGLAVLIPFILLFGAAIYHARKPAMNSRHRNLGLSVEASLWGFLVCGMSGGYALTWFPYLLLGLAGAARQIELTEPVGGDQ